MCDHAHSALLVIDMQEKFRYLGAKLLPELNLTIASCKSEGIPVIFTQHGHRYVEQDSGVLGQFWGYDDMIKLGSAEWQLMPELNAAEADLKIIEKRRYDAFYGTVLNNILKQLKVETVIISGVMTNLCCETTARSAFCHDYNVVFLSDGCGTSSAELHKATLTNIEYGFGKVVTCKEFREQLKERINVKLV